MGEIANDMINGRSCSHCGVYFEKKNGYPVLCKRCYKNQFREKVKDKIPKSKTKEL